MAVNYGLKFKSKWRRGDDGQWHCFLRDGKEWYSGCERYTILSGSIGSITNRPPVSVRCAKCDVSEILLYRREESMPQSPNWTGNGSVSSDE